MFTQTALDFSNKLVKSHDSAINIHYMPIVI